MSENQKLQAIENLAKFRPEDRKIFAVAELEDEDSGQKTVTYVKMRTGRNIVPLMQGVSAMRLYLNEEEAVQDVAKTRERYEQEAE